MGAWKGHDRRARARQGLEEPDDSGQDDSQDQQQCHRGTHSRGNPAPAGLAGQAGRDQSELLKLPLRGERVGPGREDLRRSAIPADLVAGTPGLGTPLGHGISVSAGLAAVNGALATANLMLGGAGVAGRLPAVRPRWLVVPGAGPARRRPQPV
jgi:hypothetical protein